MKRAVLVVSLGLVMAGAAFAQVRAGGTLYVGAKSVTLKSSTGFFASGRGTLTYGEQVTVLQIKGKWAEVRSASRTQTSGWTAVSNLSVKRVTAGSSTSASNSELALAGKGFNQEVENAYKARGSLNYADVDKTEAQNVPEQELYDFLTEGHLLLGEQP
jgi:uncharacterized protein YgiM (DUF1202 family)